MPEDPKPKDEDVFAKFDESQLSPELQKVYKDMQAAYTKKTMSLADQRKAYETNEAKWKEELKRLGALEKENEQWHQWWQNLEQQSREDQPGDDASGKQPTGVDYLKDSPEIAQALEAAINPLKTELASMKQQNDSLTEALKNSQSQILRMFDYQSQLSDLVREHPEIDRGKLLEHAKTTGQTDLMKVYEDLYREDIISKRVQEELTKKEQELRTQGISSPGKQVIYKPSDSSPKSFSEATQSILNKKAVEGTLE